MTLPPVTTGRPYLRHFGAGHTNGVHDFLMDELELGEAVAMALDDEACGFGPLFDVLYLCHCLAWLLCSLFCRAPFAAER